MEEATAGKRDWIALLLPTVIAIFVSLAIQIAGVAWYFGNINSRLGSAEDRIKVLESTGVTQRDITQRDTQVQVNQQELNIRLNRMDDKLDQVLENQGRHKN
jgi:hypothetical protein